jgi:hypothetical protein
MIFLLQNGQAELVVLAPISMAANHNSFFIPYLFRAINAAVCLPLRSQLLYRAQLNKQAN